MGIISTMYCKVKKTEVAEFVKKMLKNANDCGMINSIIDIFNFVIYTEVKVMADSVKTIGVALLFIAVI